jgi:tricorn protease
MLSLLAFSLPLLAAPAQDPAGAVPAGMLRYPDVSTTHIVFSYDNDLWLVPRDGGVASPLASPDGGERFPRFNADGSAVAFVGNYDGDTDLYTISTQGGFAERVTHHPANETLSDWLPNGDLLFYSNGQAGLQRHAQIFTVPAGGGMPVAMPVPYGTVSSVDESGTWLAYTPRSRDGRTWKRYRGGLATDIWLFNLKDNSARKVTDWEGTDTQPMWSGDTLYYMSDGGAAHRLNIWKLDPKSGKTEQVTFHDNDDIKWPSMGPGARGRGEIVYQLGHDLMLLDLRSGKSHSVEVVVPGERIHQRPRQVDASKFIAGWDLSPSAKRVAVEARGDIWTLAAENGVPRNLTHSNGTAERSPAWSPDGQWIAYLSDKSGEYELWMSQSDGKGETRQLTDHAGLFKLGIGWSPDSKKLIYIDSEMNMFIHSVESNETKLVDESLYGFWAGAIDGAGWSSDSRWLTYTRSSLESAQTAVWIYDSSNGEHHQVTSGFFADSNPVFDRAGEYLYFTSGRRFSPSYSGIDSSFIYEDNQVLMAMPLQADAERLWAPENDEESWEDDADSEEDEESESEEAEEGTEEDDDSGAAEETDDQDAVTDDGLTGTWEGAVSADGLPEPMPITFEIVLAADGSLSGSSTADFGDATISSGTYDAASGALQLVLATDDGGSATIEGTVKDGVFDGSGTVDSGMEFTIHLERESQGSGDSDSEGAKQEEAKEVLIDFEGLEARAIQLPIAPGNFGNLSVNNKNQLLYSRRGEKGGIKVLDIHEDKVKEKDVAGGGRFMLNADGSKLLKMSGRGASIMDAKAGASGETVSTDGMMVQLNPREEWPQLFTDAWRIFRDFFYDRNMHGVDWQGVHDHYAAMIPFCASREDVTFVIGEMIAEANVGHAYLSGNGDGSARAASVSVGMLGVDYTLENGAYRIAHIVRGADWDSDAVGPLVQQGVDVAEGDYLLAVNGIALNTAKDPWAAMIGLGGKEVLLTVSANPTMDDEARDVIVKTVSGEGNLRYREWIEKNRKYVEEQSGGRLGYIYVPDTGINGQNDLFRQFYGQILKKGLIIDERWNGGGQIPTRFIELLNRPATNYWATRGANDLHWPPDSHQGPKCMLINEDAGSGGDAFPSYFRQAGLGKLIGRRTWGGLVGISGNPGLIDGGGITVPTFGFYDNDGTWGIEGHGVDPDIEVMDDPAKMVDGGDPQLDAAIAHMLGELKSNPHIIPTRPASPDRSGVGVTEEDK